MYRSKIRKDKEVKYLSEVRKVKLVYSVPLRLESKRVKL